MFAVSLVPALRGDETQQNQLVSFRWLKMQARSLKRDNNTAASVRRAFSCLKTCASRVWPFFLTAFGLELAFSSNCASKKYTSVFLFLRRTFYLCTRRRRRHKDRKSILTAFFTMWSLIYGVVFLVYYKCNLKHVSIYLNESH